MVWWCYWKDIGLAIHRSHVQVLAGHHCIVALGKLLAKQYNLVLAKEQLRSAAGKVNWFLVLTKFSPPVNLLTYIISSLFKLTITLAPLMLSHLLVHLPPLPSRSQITLFSMPRLISGINFHFHFVNQFHLFMLISIHPSVLHSPHPSPLHSFTLNSKLTFLVNFFPKDLLP